MSAISRLIRTDRNGTKYYFNSCRCGKCNGTGIVDYYVPVNGGTCYDCNGRGIVTYTSKEYTPEYAAKLTARRNKKAMEKRMALAALYEDGKIWVVLGDTYEQKKALKEAGAFYNKAFGWYFRSNKEGFRLFPVALEDAFEKFDDGTFDFEYPKEIKVEDPEAKISQYVGEVGKKIELEVTYHHHSSYTVQITPWTYNTMWIYNFVTPDGNKLIWKTASALCDKDGNNAAKGDKLTIKASVKEHSEYKEEKQTVLTRVRVVKNHTPHVVQETTFDDDCSNGLDLED